MIKAPWTDEQVDNLNRFQHSGSFHPFTCGLWGMTRKLYGRENAKDCGYLLVATKDGWVCSRPGCPYTQDWAHDGMVNFPKDWKSPEQALKEKLFGED